VIAFRFRAQPALDLRRREHDAAQRELARADAERQRARDRVDAAGRAIADARRQADAALAGESPGEAEWYRFWIVRLDRDRTALMAALRDREADVARARAACLAARQRCEALARFREKAWAAYRAAEAAHERKTIDDIATQRFAARRDITEGA
jgi:flagellar export protein FliJ